MKRILDILGWVGTAIVIAAAAIALMPSLIRYGPYSKPLAVVGLVLVLAYTMGQWREISGMFSRRQARYGSLSAFSILVVLGILVAINYIGSKQNKRWDLTTNKQYSLSDQTRNILAKLDAPLQVTVFAKELDFPQYQDRMKEYQYSSKRISTEYVDPDKKPTIAKQNQIQQYGTIVFNYKGRSERVTADTEQDITTGIIKVVQGQTKKIYFSQGHGEKDTGSQDREGYGSIAAALGRENYTIDKVVIAQTGAVPDDAAVVIVAGPKIDFFAPEVDALKKFLDKPGKVFLELDPPDKPDSQPLTNLIALAHSWGIDVNDDIVFDLSGMGRLVGTSEVVPLAASYPPHAITERFRLVTAYPLARSVTAVAGGVNGHTAQGFVETSPQSLAKTDVKAVLASKDVQIDEKKDKKGPFILAAAVSATATPATPPTPGDSAPKPEARLIVTGDSDFAANAYLGIGGNRDLYMNMVGWLSQQENLISIRPKDPDDRRITMTANQQFWISWFAVAIMPL
ncbi:MAG TPA: GldG family protein, partial [Vicinamibacterales bacterium]|nr:GldG family protein [Vicinamibacterales bacterium]